MPELHIDLQSQTLSLNDSGKVIADYIISSGLKGIGQQEGSEQTPLGRHAIAEKIGENAPHNAVFVGRIPTGEIFSKSLYEAEPGRDWILTRILWLKGLEPGFNQGGNCDTQSRYIYIHGTPDFSIMGKPGSRGCIRMRNSDIVTLFDLIHVDDIVTITA